MLRSCLVAIVLFSGCARFEVQKLTAFDTAMKLSGPERPKLFFDETLDSNALPALVPYATVFTAGRRPASKESLSRRIWQEGARIKADVVVVVDQGSAQTGYVAANYGWGITTIDPVFERIITGVCFRLPKARIGFKTDETGMVVWIDPDSQLFSAGLLEGDKLLSINGALCTSGSNQLKSSHNITALNLNPGDDVKLIWIRQGTGRMEGTARCLPNPPTHLALPDAIKWQNEAVRPWR